MLFLRFMSLGRGSLEGRGVLVHLPTSHRTIRRTGEQHVLMGH